MLKHVLKLNNSMVSSVSACLLCSPCTVSKLNVRFCLEWCVDGMRSPTEAQSV